jgi:hypothetical protein
LFASVGCASYTHAAAVGLDFTDIDWRKRMRLAARRIATKKLVHCRTWSISGFKMFTAYPDRESSDELCSFAEIAVGATSTHDRAARHRVPGCVCPFDSSLSHRQLQKGSAVCHDW